MHRLAGQRLSWCVGCCVCRRTSSGQSRHDWYVVNSRTGALGCPRELEEAPIVGGLDIHRRQLTFDYLDTVTGQVRRGQVARPTGAGSALIG